VAIFGEIGGTNEEEAAEAVRRKEFTKPLVIYVAGAWAPEGMRFPMPAVLWREEGVRQRTRFRILKTQESMWWIDPMKSLQPSKNY